MSAKLEKESYNTCTKVYFDETRGRALIGFLDFWSSRILGGERGGGHLSKEDEGIWVEGGYYCGWPNFWCTRFCGTHFKIIFQMNNSSLW
jgi:hypothetical protein